MDIINCQPVRNGMSTFLISAQSLSQYGDYGSFHGSFFKPKGATEYIIHTNGRIWDAVVYVTMMLRQDDDLNTPPLNYKLEPQGYYEIVNHWEEVELDQPIDSEHYIRPEMDKEEIEDLMKHSSSNRIVLVMNESTGHPPVSEADVTAVHTYWTINGLKWKLDELPRIETDDEEDDEQVHSLPLKAALKENAMSYMKHYQEWLKDEKLLNKPDPMSHIERYQEENPQMIPKPIVKEEIEN